MTAGRRGRGWLAKGHMRQRDPGRGPPALGADRGAFILWGAPCPFPGLGSFGSQTINRQSDHKQAGVQGTWIQSRGMGLDPFFLWIMVRPLQGLSRVDKILFGHPHPDLSS